MPGAWEDYDRQRAEDGYDHAPPGASAAEGLAHEIALAAALDRSRQSLSPDAQASARMKARLFEAMAEQGMTPPSAPAAHPTELTAPLGAPVPDLEPDVSAAQEPSVASVNRAAGEHTLAERRSRTRRARHVLPEDHPDHPGGTADAATQRNRSRPGDGRPAAGPAGRRRPSVRKRFGIVVTALAALAVLAGVAATASRNALPGDALYGVKRATETTGGAFTFGDQASAARQLELARTRVDEIEDLVGRDTPPDPATVTAAIDDFDRAASNGSRLMLSEDRSAGGSQLGDLRTWASAQSGRIEQLRSSMPQPAVPEADHSIALLDRVLNRTEALRARTNCSDSGTDSVDDLGPLPSTGACLPESGSTSEPSQQAGERERTEPGTSSSSPESSSSTGSSESTSPSSPSSERSTEPSQPLAPLPSLLDGDSARKQSGEPTSPSSSSDGSSTSTTEEPAPLLPPITLPPLLPGLGPVTIG